MPKHILAILVIAIALSAGSRGVMATTLVVGEGTYTCDEAGLKAAVTAANENDIITFDAQCTSIVLTSTEPVTIDKDLTIDSGGFGLVTVDGNGNGLVFSVTGFNTVAKLVGLRIQNGDSGDGGGINNLSTVILIDSLVINNNAVAGGGIAHYGDELIIVNSAINNNSASTGGGIFRSGNDITLVNSIMSGNSASGRGGAIGNFGATTSKTFIINSTLSGNSGNEGGAIANITTLILRNSIVANSPSGGDIFEDMGTVITEGVNIVEDGSVTGANVINADPVLNGNLVPSAGSPAIDAGSNGLIANERSLDVDYYGDGQIDGAIPDIAGKPRLQNRIVDLGAYEVGDLEITALDTNNNSSVSPVDGVYVANRIGTNDLSADVNGDGSVTEADIYAVTDNAGLVVSN